MKKKVLITAVAAMTCMAMAGCSNSSSKVVEIAPGVTIVATGNQGTLTMEPNEENPLATVDFVDPMGDASTEEEYVPVVESVADSFNVKLEDNQYIITANDKNEEAIVFTAPEGYKFENRYGFNEAYLVNEDYSDSYLIIDSTGTLTKESLTKMKDVEDKGDGCFIEKKEAIKAFCFKDDASISIVYNNTKDENVDVDKAVAAIKALVAEMKICK